MPRPQRKEINFTKESILSLMQEIYNELVEQRNTALRIQNKMITMMKDPMDMQTIGPVIEKQQKIINDCVEKKLSLSKLQAQIWQKSQDKQENFTLTTESKEDISQYLIFELYKRGIYIPPHFYDNLITQYIEDKKEADEITTIHINKIMKSFTYYDINLTPIICNYAF